MKIPDETVQKFLDALYETMDSNNLGEFYVQQYTAQERWENAELLLKLAVAQVRSLKRR